MSEKISRRALLAAAAVPVLRGGSPASWREPVPLGRSGLNVTPLGLAPAAHDSKLILQAVDYGINHLNVFAFYKDESEFPFVREALKSVREKVILAAGSGESSKAGVLSEIDRKLKIFETDVIDLWYFASPKELNDGMLEAARLTIKAGKVRACAVSTHRFAAMTPRLLEVRDTVSAVMVACNYATWDGGKWTDAAENIRKLRSAGIGIVSMKAMMGGSERRPDAVEAALRWILRNPQVDTSPVSMSSLEQLNRNVKAASLASTDFDERVLRSEVDRISPAYCRMCQRCEGSCRAGLPVADILRFLMYAEGYGRREEARQLFSSVPSRCLNCRRCAVNCPNGVLVCRRIKKAQSLLS